MTVFIGAVIVAVVVAGWYLIRTQLGLTEEAIAAMEKAAAEREAEERAEDAIWRRVEADTSEDWLDHFTASELAMADRAARRQRVREEAARAAARERQER
jgi:hypothetical protein